MKSKTGLHFYINVKNFNDIVEDEELRGGVNHSIINELARSNKSYDELMAFLKGEYDE